MNVPRVPACRSGVSFVMSQGPGVNLCVIVKQERWEALRKLSQELVTNITLAKL